MYINICIIYAHYMYILYINVATGEGNSRNKICSYFKESFSGEYHMYQVILLHPCDYLYKVLIKTNVATDEDNS